MRVRTASSPCTLTSPTSTVSDRSPAFSVAVRVTSEVPSGAMMVTSTVPPPSQAPCRAVTASSSACAHAWTRVPVPAALSIVAYPTAVRRGTPGRAVSSDASASCSWDAGAFGDAVEVDRPRSTSSAVGARYPRRALTSTPARFTRTLMLRAVPSSFALLDA